MLKTHLLEARANFIYTTKENSGLKVYQNWEIEVNVGDFQELHCHITWRVSVNSTFFETDTKDKFQKLHCPPQKLQRA